MKANKGRPRKRANPGRMTRPGARHEATGFSKIERSFLRHTGQWWNEGYPGHE